MLPTLQAMEPTRGFRATKQTAAWRGKNSSPDLLPLEYHQTKRLEHRLVFRRH
jgi:hypothetical protein